MPRRCVVPGLAGLAALVALAGWLPAAGAKGIDDFKLTRAIPADAFLVVHARQHDGQEFVKKQYARVWEELEKVRLDRDLKRLVKSLQPPRAQPPDEGETDPFEAQWQQITDLLAAVDWANLSSREYAMGMKLGMPFEFVCLMMPPEESLSSNFEGLSGIAKHLVELSGGLFELTTDQDGATVIHQLSMPQAPLPMGFTLAKKKDVILLGFGPQMCEQAMALLDGEEGATVAASPNFKAALKKLPAPTDALMFFDSAKFMDQLREFTASLMGMAPAPPPDSPDYPKYEAAKKIPGKLFDQLDMVEYCAAVRTTDGMKSVQDGVCLLKDSASSSELYPVFFGNPPLDKPLRYVPQEAGDFWVTNGVDLHALYNFAIKFMRENVPDGEKALAHIDALNEWIGTRMPLPTRSEKALANNDALNEQVGFDIEKDLIAFIGGGLTSISVPGPTPYSPADSALLLSVKDEAKAQAMMDRLIGMAEGFLSNPQAQGQASLVDAEIEGVPGFKSLNMPMLAMLGMNKPTFGVGRGMLMIGSSPDMISKVLATGGGSGGDFSKNERFQAEGIAPEGAVISLSFSDQTKLGEQLSQALSMAPMLGMMAGDAAKNPVVTTALGVAGKLGRVARKLDFFQSSATRTTMDGKAIVSRTITTYREPPEKTKPSPPSDQ